MVIKAEKEKLAQAAALAAELWPRHTPEELLAEFEQVSGAGGVLFLAMEGDTPVGFAQCRLRHDYVEGTDSSPVGYLEGVYVLEQYRRRSVARSLLAACEAWAAGRGCTEFASDCELHHTDSLRFHLGCGFHEANRIICLTKRLGTEEKTT